MHLVVISLHLESQQGPPGPVEQSCPLFLETIMEAFTEDQDWACTSFGSAQTVIYKIKLN